MRLIEIRLLEGPNVYRLEPVVKLEVAIGRRRTWYGRREPEAHARVRLGAAVPRTRWSEGVANLVAWVRRLRTEHDEAGGLIRVHRSSDPGHWIVTWPWRGEGRAQAIAEAAFELAERGVTIPASSRDTAAAAGRSARAGRLLGRWAARIRDADATPPAWIRDPDRTMPVISISGTNGKSTTARLVSHILHAAGKRVGTTTSDGVLVNEAVVLAGDWTGPGGAHEVLRRPDLDVAVLETARGGIVLRGVGYESNEASVLTNVSSDHLDLQGIHTLPELAEVKATICRMTRPDGWVILNADDRHVAELGRRAGVGRDGIRARGAGGIRARVAYFSLAGDRSPLVRRHLAGGGRAYLVRGDRLGEAEGRTWRPIVRLWDVPIAFGGIARHNVANALAASGGARAMGASIDEVRRGLASFEPTAGASPGRLNVFRRDGQLVIVDFAHNEAGLTALLDVARGIAGGAPLTAVIGTAGDRPDDTLRGMGRIAARRADRVAIKESLHYLRGRTRESVVGEIRAGARGAGWRAEIPVYQSETAALEAELDLASGATGQADPGANDDRSALVLLCHEDRDAVFRLLADRGFEPLESIDAIRALLPPTSRSPVSRITGDAS